MPTEITFDTFLNVLFGIAIVFASVTGFIRYRMGKKTQH